VLSLAGLNHGMQELAEGLPTGFKLELSKRVHELFSFCLFLDGQG
jgi:hypothetical protein